MLLNLLPKKKQCKKIMSQREKYIKYLRLSRFYYPLQNP